MPTTSRNVHSFLVNRCSQPTWPVSTSTQSIPSIPSVASVALIASPLKLLGVVAGCLLGLSPVGLLAQEAKATVYAPDYSKIVVFGDSLSDTGNVADLTEKKYGVRIPGPYADYTDGRFTDGLYTEPAAQKYSGVWIEQLAETFPSKPPIKASLDGGTNYAYGFATTGSGTSKLSFPVAGSPFVEVNNIGLQITDYLATHPKINDKTLFVVWGGANDLLTATSDEDVIEAGINQTLNVQRLIDAGATRLLVVNLPPLGLVPRLNGSASESAVANQGAEVFNDVLAGGLAFLKAFDRSKHVELAQLDTFTLFEDIVAAPAKFSLDNINDSSQGQPVDPDTYLFWDDLHPTTHGHNILAEQAAKALATADAELAKELSHPAVEANR